MLKKVFAMWLTLALIFGLLPATVLQVSAGSDDVDYRVGYAKVDANPYWSLWEKTGGTIPADKENYAVDQNGNPIGSWHIMPLPMGGYGGNVHRLSRPELVDDNGSGLHADGVVYLTDNRPVELGGQNDGDGLWITCVSVQQNEDAEPVLFFSIDMIGFADSYSGRAKNLIIRTLREKGITITPDRILINATHTHGGVALGEDFDSSTTYYQKLWGNTKTVGFSGSELTSYLSAYRSYLYEKMAEAAVEALTEAPENGEVVMRKGTVDVSQITGYQLNGVRHSVAEKEILLDGEETLVQYATGSSFNVFSGDKEIAAVSDSDDKMHVIQFSFPDAEPILMVNWRAHTTWNNKMNTAAHNNLSADFVAAMRYQLERFGYRPILNYGASGNLGTGDTPSTYNIGTSTTTITTKMPGVDYGYKLALAAKLLVAGIDDETISAACQDNLTSLQTRINTASTNATNAQTKANTAKTKAETAQSNAETAQSNADKAQQNADNASWDIFKDYYLSQRDKYLEQVEEYIAERDKQLAEQAKQLTNQENYEKRATGFQARLEELTALYAAMENGTQTLPMETCAQGPILVDSTYYDVTPQTSSESEKQAALYHNAKAKYEEGGSASNDGGLKLEASGYPFLVTAGTHTVTYTKNGEEVTETFEVAEPVVLASQYHANSLINRYGTLNKKRIGLSALTLGDQVAFVTMPFEASDRYSSEATLATANAYNDWLSLNNESKWGTPIIMSLTNGAEGYFANKLAYEYAGVVDGRDYDLQQAFIEGKTKDANGNPSGFVNGSYEALGAYAAKGEGEKVVKTLKQLLDGLLDGQEAPVLKTGYCSACKKEATWVPLNDKVVEDNGNSLVTDHYYLSEDYENQFDRILVYANDTVCLDLNGKTVYSNTTTGTSRCFTLYGTLNVQDSGTGGKLMGKAAGNGKGGSIYISNIGVLNLFSGTITCDITGSGKVANGGVICVSTGGTFNMYGGQVTGGKASGNGGNIYVDGGTFELHGGTVSAGKATTNGGNIYVNSGVYNMRGGEVTGGEAGTNGGNVYANGGVAQMYGGRLTGGTSNGGGNLLVAVGGTFYLHGGAVTGGNSTLYGGNVQVQGGVMHMYGGELSGGTATSSGGNMLVSGNPKGTFRYAGGYIPSGTHIMGNLELGGAPTGNDRRVTFLRATGNVFRVTLVDTFYSDVQIRYNMGSSFVKNGGDYELAVGKKVASVTGGTIDPEKGRVTVCDNNGNVKGYASVNGELLELVATAPVYVAKQMQNGEYTYFENLTQALNADTTPESPLVLTKRAASLTLTKDLHLDLNACPVSGITTGSYNLTVLDSATDDYVGDYYGSIPGDVTYQAAESYLPVTEDGKTSFHRYALQIKQVTLKTAKAGLSYNCFIAGDRKVKEQVSEFGIAMSVYKPSTAQDIFLDSQSKTHVWRSGSLWQTGTAGQELTSVAVIYIMKGEGYTNGAILSDKENQNRANIPVYGRAYMLLKNGEYILGEPASRTLQSVTEEIDKDYYPNLGENQKYLQNLYNAFRSVMEDWNLSNIKESLGIR